MSESATLLRKVRKGLQGEIFTSHLKIERESAIQKAGGNSIPDRRVSECKGPEVENRLDGV